MLTDSDSQATSRVRGLFRRWTAFSSANAPWLVLLFLLLAAGAAWVATQRIRVDADLESLLPQSSPTIRALKETKARYGSTDLFTVSIVDSDPGRIAAVQDRIVRKMRADWPDVVFVQDDRDATFFRDHALLYLPTSYLQQLLRRLESTRDEIKRGPLGMDLLADEPAPKGPWFDATLPQQLGLPDEAADEFEKFLKPADASTTKDRNADDPKAGVPDSLRSRLIGRLADGKFVGVVQAVLKKPSSDIEYVKTVLARSDAMLAPFRSEFGGMRIGVEGPYKDFQEVEELSSNGTVATVISVGLTLLIILLFFRSSGPIFLVLGQAVISCALTLGFVGLAYGRLNLYTMFVIAILFGMGTDFSFYLVGYAQRLVRQGASWEEAVERSLTDMFSSLVAAATTTIAGLLTLLVSRFAGFYEFGVIATFGIGASFLLTYLFLPAAILLSQRLAGRPLLGWLRMDPRARAKEPAPSRFPYERFSNTAAAIAIAGAVILLPFAFRIGFEYDFSHLRQDHSGKGISRITAVVDGIANRITGRGRKASDDLPVREALNSKRTSSQPVVILAKDAASLDALHDTLLRRLTVDRDTFLRSFLTLRTFVPAPRDQAERLPFMARIDSVLADPVFSKATGDDEEMVKMLRRQVRAKSFGARDIPEWSLNMLRERDSSYGRIAFVYGRFNSSDSREAAKFEARYGHLVGGTEELSCFSSSFVYADVVRLVREDSIRMSFLMLGILVVLLAALLRKPRAIAVCLLGMATCLAWMLGLMGLFGVKVGVFNLIVITTIQAALTDVVIYLVLAWERGGRRDLPELYTGIGVLMSVAIGTTVAGYAGMSFTTHLGIRSMGNFALLGLGSCLLVSLAVTPWLCRKLLPPGK
jgi:predicted RND superfamily exporter protein